MYEEEGMSEGVKEEGKSEGKKGRREKREDRIKLLRHLVYIEQSTTRPSQKGLHGRPPIPFLNKPSIVCKHEKDNNNKSTCALMEHSLFITSISSVTAAHTVLKV